MPQNLSRVIDQVSKDRGINRAVLIDAIEKAFVKVAQREYGKNKEIEAAYNADLDEVELFEFRQVVDEIEGLVPGLDRTLTVDLAAGDYTYVCKLAGHDAAGMHGTLTVTAN